MTNDVTKTFDYMYTLSKVICRFRKFIKDTDCTWSIFLAISIGSGFLVEAVPLMSTLNHPSFGSICFGMVWTMTKIYLYGMSVIYVGYELFHGLKWLGEWAERYPYTRK